MVLRAVIVSSLTPFPSQQSTFNTPAARGNVRTAGIEPEPAPASNDTPAGQNKSSTGQKRSEVRPSQGVAPSRKGKLRTEAALNLSPPRPSEPPTGARLDETGPMAGKSVLAEPETSLQMCPEPWHNHPKGSGRSWTQRHPGNPGERDTDRAAQE